MISTDLNGQKVLYNGVQEMEIEKIEIVPNHPTNDKKLVAVIHASDPNSGFSASATSDKFTLIP